MKESTDIRIYHNTKDRKAINIADEDYILITINKAINIADDEIIWIGGQHPDEDLQKLTKKSEKNLQKMGTSISGDTTVWKKLPLQIKKIGTNITLDPNESNEDKLKLIYVAIPLFTTTELEEAMEINRKYTLRF